MEGTPKLWEKTFQEFLEKRLRTRYLDPICTLMKKGSKNGEGFLIVSVLCALIEFLAALEKGKKYKFGAKKGDIGTHEYNSSSELFCDFLCDNPPFKEVFTCKKRAKDFYRDVRCGLLHEARTKKEWRINTSQKLCINFDTKIIDRVRLKFDVENYIKRYGERLTKDKYLQEGFIRKFDHLCDLPDSET